MINMRSALFAGLMTCLAVVSSWAQTPTVPEPSAAPRKPLAAEKPGKLGDPAPPIIVGEWIKGKPVRIQPGTNIYVLVFCTLSRANEFALTNLNALQKKYEDKGVVVVAISGEPAESLKEFVQIKGADIDFTVAADDDARELTTSYQRMFRQMILPRAYIVGKDGNVLWLGHPLRDDMGLVVDEITSGRYNLEQEQKKIAATRQMDDYLALARQGEPQAAKIGQLMLALRTNDAPALFDLAGKIAIDPYIGQRDIALATAALDRAEQISMTNATGIAITRAILLFQTGQEEAGLAKAKLALANAKTDADRSEVSNNIRAMEALLAMAKTNQVNRATNSNSPTEPAPQKP
jgi:hypothetical protein